MAKGDEKSLTPRAGAQGGDAETNLSAAGRIECAALSVVHDDTQPVKRKLAAAALLLSNGLLSAAIDAHGHIAVAHPSARALCELNIGAAFFFQRRFGEALKHYRWAALHGADPDEVAALIAEAETARDAAT